MSKRNVDMRIIPLNSRKITVTNESQISRNFWVHIRKIKIVRSSHNVHEWRDLLQTYMCMSLTECLFVVDSAWGAVLIHVSASCEGQERGNEKGLMKIRTYTNSGIYKLTCCWALGQFMVLRNTRIPSFHLSYIKEILSIKGFIMEVFLMISYVKHTRLDDTCQKRPH
jgi:hypothetical protein